MVDLLFYLGAIVLFFGGSNVLAHFGWYVDATNVPLHVMIMPSFYIFVSAAFLSFVDTGVKRFSGKMYEVMILVSSVLLIVVLKSIDRDNFLTTITNCIMLPALASLLTGGELLKKEGTKKIILAFYFAECGIALLERLLAVNFFPFTGGDASLASGNIDLLGFRSTSLQNHPIQNALSVSIVAHFVLVSNLKFKYPLWILGYIAILCFNTRSSIMVWAASFGVYVLHLLFIEHRESLSAKLVALLTAILGSIGILYLMIAKGWGQRLLNMGVMDEDSSEVRLRIWNVFDFYSLSDFIIGVSSKEIIKIKQLTGVLIIENYWLVFLFQFGFVFLLLFAFFYYKIVAGYIGNGISFRDSLPVVSFLVISSTNNSLATNSAAFTLFILCCFVFGSKNMDLSQKVGRL